MATANSPQRNDRDQPTADSSAPSDRQQLGAARVGLLLLLVGGCLVVLVWSGYSGYSVAETYGRLRGAWVLAVGAGGVVGAGLVAVARLLDRATPAGWLVVASVALALFVATVGTHLGLLEHTAASARAEHACDDPVGRALVSFAQGLQPGPLVTQDGELTRGESDGRCSVMVNVAPDADVAAEIARVAAAKGWTRIHNGWLSPDGVSMTYDATYEPEAMALVGGSPSRFAVTATNMPTMSGNSRQTRPTGYLASSSRSRAHRVNDRPMQIRVRNDPRSDQTSSADRRLTLPATATAGSYGFPTAPCAVLRSDRTVPENQVRHDEATSCLLPLGHRHQTGDPLASKARCHDTRCHTSPDCPGASDQRGFERHRSG